MNLEHSAFVELPGDKRWPHMHLNLQNPVDKKVTLTKQRINKKNHINFIPELQKNETKNPISKDIRKHL